MSGGAPGPSSSTGPTVGPTVGASVGQDPPSPLTVAMSMMLVGTPMLPPFGLAALAEDIRASFAVSGPTVGALVATFFVTSALVSRRAGGIAQRDGATTSLVLAASCISTAMLGIGAFGTSVPVLAVFCAIAGVGNAFAHVCANLLFTRRVPPHRRALSFGLKQAAIPIASLSAGLAVPLAHALGGWRRVFLVYGTVTLSALVWAVREFRRGRAARRAAAVAPVRRDSPLPARGVLVLAALGAALGVGPMTVVASFLVLAGVEAGIRAVDVGLMLAAGSAVAIVLRVVFGLLVDARIARGRSTGVPALMVGVLVVSAAGLALMDAAVPWRFALGALLGLGLGWAWHGLLDLSVVRLYAEDAARATGISQIGAYVGGIAGPLGGGFLVDAVGADLVWLLCAASCLGAAAAFGAAARRAARAPGLVPM